MIRSIYTVNRNMNILQKKQENTSANIANVKTPGYKFQDIIQSTMESYDMVNYKDGPREDRRQVLGQFVFGNQIDEYIKNFDQGSILETGLENDYAIVGNGFFTVQMADGQLAYTRNGNFRLDEANQLVTMNGNTVLGQGQTNIVKNQDGTLSANLLISDFVDYQGLESIGNTLFTSNEAAIEMVDAKVSSGFLEMSNVDIASELVRMIEISREFESNQKLLHTADETLNKAVNEIGRVRWLNV